MTWSRVMRSLPVLLLILFVCSTSVWGQFGASTIRGTITDPSGAVVANATVTITNLETNLQRSQTTNSAGSYSFDLIPTGDYKVEIKNDKAVIWHGKEATEAQVKVENTEQKNRSNVVRYGADSRVQEIRLGGTKTKLVFEGETGSATPAGQ